MQQLSIYQVLIPLNFLVSSDNIADLLYHLSADSITVYVPNQNCIDELQYMVDSKITLALKNAG